jgi:DNA-binding NarL/FixJ family response regulator
LVRELADDHRIVLDGLIALLRVEPDLEVIAHAESGRVAVQLAQQLAPDVVVMDISMPDMDGIEATQRIKTNNPRTNIVALSARADDESALQIIEAGATGYVGKESAFRELATAIRTVLARRPYWSPPVAAAIDRHRGQQARLQAARLLTVSERDIVQLAAEGQSAEQIASSLGFTTSFVEARLARTMQRLGLSNLADLVRYAIREGLRSLEH